MREILARTGLHLVARGVTPLLLGALAYLILALLLRWPPTVAFAVGVLAGCAVWRDIHWRLGDRTSPRAAGQVLAGIVAEYGSWMLIVVLLRHLLVVLGWLPGSASLAAFGAGFVVSRVIRVMVTDQGMEVFVRGQRPVTRGQAVRAMERLAGQAAADPQASLPSPVWCGVPLPPRAAENHFLALGMPGAGKSTIFRVLMGSVLRDIGRLPGHRALVYDDKRDYLPLLRRLVDPSRVISMNPFDQNGYGWDIAADVQDPATAMQVAANLIPATPGDKNAYFTNAARELLSGVMEAFNEIAPQAWTFWDVLVAVSRPERLRLVLCQTTSTASLVETYFGARSGADIISTLREKTGLLRTVAAGWRQAPMISMSDWIDGQGIIVLSNDELVREPLMAVNRALFGLMAQLLLNQGEPVSGRTWVFLDEMREASRLEEAHSLLNRGRSKKVTVVLGFQAIEGLKAIYEDNVAEELAGQCGIKALMAVESVPSRSWASQVLGVVDQMEYQRSWGRDVTVSEHRNQRPVVLPEQFAQMPRLQTHGVLAAWCLTPYSPPFYQEVAGEALNELTRPVEVPDPEPYCRRQPGELVLGDWEQEDHDRLNLRELPDEAPGDDGPDGGDLGQDPGDGPALPPDGPDDPPPPRPGRGGGRDRKVRRVPPLR